MELCYEMPLIKKCDVAECVYNVQSDCHAKAITIGDGVHPGCDTFMKGSGHVRSSGIKAGVGACKVSGCSHNTDFECNADSINVSRQSGMVHCMTYMPR